MVTRLVNSVMLDGKKGVAQKIVYEAFSMIQEKTGNDPLETFEKAMENIMPSLECKDPPCRWCKLSGSSGSQPRPPRDSGSALVDRLQPQPW